MEPSRFVHRDLPNDLNLLAEQVVDAVFEVRKELGAGLLESVYKEAFAIELELRGIAYVREPPLPITYKARLLTKRYHPDFLVEDAIVVEAKAVTDVHPNFFAQLLTYLRLSSKSLGFLVNFSEIPHANGIHRRVNTLERR